MTLKIKFPFAYTDRVRVSPSADYSYEEDVARLETFDFDVAERSNEEAPVVLIYEEGASRRRPERADIHFVRHWEKGFATTISWRTAGKRETSMPKGLLARRTIGPESAGKFLAFFDVPSHGNEWKKIASWIAGNDDRDFGAWRERTVVSSNRSERLEQAMALASRMLIVGEHVYMGCEEPKIGVFSNREAGGPIIQVHTGRTDYGTEAMGLFSLTVGTPAETGFFRIDDIEAARAWAAEIGDGTELEWVRDITLRPDIPLSFDREAEIVARTAQALVAAADVGELSAEGVTAWLDVRSMLEGKATEGLEAAVRTTLSHLPEGETRALLERGLGGVAAVAPVRGADRVM
jgi:hypothetical protein